MNFHPFWPADWDQLTEKLLRSTWRTPTEGREIRLKLLVVDSGGEDGVTANAEAWFRRVRKAFVTLDEGDEPLARRRLEVGEIYEVVQASGTCPVMSAPCVSRTTTRARAGAPRLGVGGGGSQGHTKPQQPWRASPRLLPSIVPRQAASRRTTSTAPRL